MINETETKQIAATESNEYSKTQTKLGMKKIKIRSISKLLKLQKKWG